MQLCPRVLHQVLKNARIQRMALREDIDTGGYIVVLTNSP
jgi:hypothetical protein